jgi:transcriptional regulator with XRE-family HTH domain
MENENVFGEYLNKKYAEWLAKQTINDGNKKNFAKYLDISYSMLSEFFHGSRLPARRTLYSMAYILGPQIYEILNMEKPKTGIEEVARRWDDLSDEVQLKIIELVKADQKR